MHEHVTHKRYVESFRAFAEAVMRFFTSALPKNCKSFRDIITDSFYIVRPNDFRVIGQAR